MVFLSFFKNNKPVLRYLARLYYKLRFILSQKRHFNRHCIEYIDGQPIVVLPKVFNPRIMLTGAFFAQLLNAKLIPPCSTVLELGTGSGVLSIFAARHSSSVTAVDIHPEAVRCAKINTVLHRLESKIEVIEGDLFEPVSGRKFDVVLFSPPFYRGNPKKGLDFAYYFGDIPKRFAEGLARHLKPGGCALLLLSTVGNCDVFLKSLRSKSYIIEAVYEKDILSEILTVFHIRPSN